MISATARVLGFVRDQLDDNLAEAVDQLQGKSAADIADDGRSTARSWRWPTRSPPASSGFS
jgi:hypothetical protein